MSRAVKDFHRKRSLNGVGNRFGQAVSQIISEHEHYCLGYHVRHFLQSEHQPVTLLAPKGDLRKAKEIFRANEAHGLHTLNHVVDSLLPFNVAVPGRSAAGLALVLRTKFDPSHEHQSLLHVSSLANEDEAVINKVLAGWDTKCAAVRSAVFVNKVAERDPSADRNLPGLAFSGGSRGMSELADRCLPAAHDLCGRLTVTPSVLAYRALLAAFYQLSTYASEFGNETLVIVLRPGDPFGFASGATTITKDRLHGSTLEAVLDQLQTHSTLLQGGGEIEDGGYRDLTSYGGLRFADGGDREGMSSQVPPRVLEAVDSALPRGWKTGKNNLELFRSNRLITSVESFLRLCGLFCNEALEGTPLQYGLILGNPFLMQFWPGPLPVPVSRAGQHSLDEWFDTDEVPKQVHLLEGASERCVAVPFQRTAGPGDPLAAYVLDLVDLQDAIASWSGHVWSATLAPYIYFTRRYPWAFAAVIGPHSEARCFVAGNLLAYRDGKGWRVCQDGVSRIEEESDGYFQAFGDDADRAKALLSAASRVALQLSPIARPGSHGGLLAYVPGEDPDLSICEDLVSAEPGRLDGDSRWLTGLSLLDAHEDMDAAVANLVLRAGVLDGAVVMSGGRGTVRRFATRLVVSSDDEPATAGGTKLRTSLAIVRHFGEGSFAFAVSSDGPVRLSYWCPGNGPRTIDLVR